MKMLSIVVLDWFWIHADFLLGLLFISEDGDNKFL
jgi:hypothetical protein